MPPRRATALVAVALAVLSAACSPAVAGGGATPPLRLGFFANMTHGTAIVGIEEGLFAEALGDAAPLVPQTFNAGPEVIEALFSGALDAAYIGPNPAINAWVRSRGEAIRIVAGAASGGASLVVRRGIDSAADLGGTRLASPQLGNTQDVALRAWLADHGFGTDLEGGGDVSIVPQPNGQSLEAFIAGEIDGAWVPEPWATRMVDEAGGVVLVDERDLWPDGAFVTTHLVVARPFLADHPGIVERLLRGHVAANRYLDDQPDDARAVITQAIEEITGTTLPEGTLERAWPALTFTNDPVAHSLQVSADRAVAIGILDSADLGGIHDLTLLNRVLEEAGQTPVSAP